MALSGCTSRDAELAQYIAKVKQEQPTGVKPLPEVRPYENFQYSAQALRSPFMPGTAVSLAVPGLRPDSHRTREVLERYALDTLKMVGTLQMRGKYYGLVQSKDGLVHMVLPGSFMGQNDGRIVSITVSKIKLNEIVPDGLGGYVERPAELALND
ncbi:MAG: hypothetical protein RLZZ393_1809 [Pseudomonadota bacterium]|jgi:type IV pilus assembly protein PilP